MKQVKDILEESVETYIQKERDYGESWRITGHVLFQMAKGEEVVLKSPEDWIAVGLYTRRMDKFTRSFNSEMLDEEMNFEAGVDSDEDEIPYAAMQAQNKYQRGSDDE